MLFIAIELNALPVITILGKGITDVLLFFFGDGTELFLNMIIGSCTESLHNAQSDATQIGGTHVVKDV